MTSGPDSTLDSALSILSDDGPLKTLAEDFARHTSDVLVRRLEGWFWNRAKTLWDAAKRRVHGSGRVPKSPRVEAFLAITKLGASEERPDIRDAFENLAARAMTDDELDHNYEQYALNLSRLDSEDISVLSIINRAKQIRDENPGGSDFEAQIPQVSAIAEEFDLDPHELMGAIDRLEKNALVQVIVLVSGYGERVPGIWVDRSALGIRISSFAVAPTALGIDLLHHIESLGPR